MMCVSDEHSIRLAGKERNRTFAPRGYLSLLPVRVRPKIVRFTVRVKSGGRYPEDANVLHSGKKQSSSSDTDKR